MDILEIFGLLATITVFVSFLPKNIKFIRWANLIGSVFFVIYGFGIGAFWTGFMNACLIFVQLYHLFKIYKGEKKCQAKSTRSRKKSKKVI